MLGRLWTTVATATLYVLLVDQALLTTASSTSSSTGLADYVRAGLGLNVEAQTTIASSSRSYKNSSLPGNTTTTSADAQISACAQSWASYSSREHLSNIVSIYGTFTTYYAKNTTLIYGTGDVYTTKDGIPVASGNFTPTRSIETVVNMSSTWEQSTLTTYDTAEANRTPTCTVSPHDCSVLYEAYIASLGLPYNASVPRITPAPSNSPPCPAYFYKTYSSCWLTGSHEYQNGCVLYGNSVRIFYFPPQTAASNGSMTMQIQNQTTPLVVQSFAPGTTFTSPSVYLSFDYISAQKVWYGQQDRFCSSCGPEGCSVGMVDGGMVVATSGTGTMITGHMISLAPEEVSTMVLDIPEQHGSSLIDIIAHGRPGYLNANREAYILNRNVIAEPLRIQDLEHPPPRAYYLQPRTTPRGCDYSYPSPECSTIFEGQYRALISLPSEVTDLQGPWKTCAPVLYGVYDPPTALSQASTIGGATLPHYKSSSTPTPVTSMPAVPAPTTTVVAPTSTVAQADETKAADSAETMSIAEDPSHEMPVSQDSSEADLTSTVAADPQNTGPRVSTPEQTASQAASVAPAQSATGESEDRDGDPGNPTQTTDIASSAAEDPSYSPLFNALSVLMSALPSRSGHSAFADQGGPDAETAAFSSPTDEHHPADSQSVTTSNPDIDAMPPYATNVVTQINGQVTTMLLVLTPLGSEDIGLNAQYTTAVAAQIDGPTLSMPLVISPHAPQGDADTNAATPYTTAILTIINGQSITMSLVVSPDPAETVAYTTAVSTVIDGQSTTVSLLVDPDRAHVGNDPGTPYTTAITTVIDGRKSVMSLVVTPDPQLTTQYTTAIPTAIDGQSTTISLALSPSGSSPSSVDGEGGDSATLRTQTDVVASSGTNDVAGLTTLASSGVGESGRTQVELVVMLGLGLLLHMA